MSATVLITGAAGNLGQAVTARFRAEGARLLLLDRQAASLEASWRGQEDVAVIGADLLQPEQVEAAVLYGIKRFGRIDVACHLAGGFRMGEAVHETSPSTWDFLMDLNARSLVHIARSVVPRMLEHCGGRIVTVGAGAAQKGMSHMGAYCAAKSALVRLTEAMSAELKNQGIGVNCVLPSIIDTPENRAAMPNADPTSWVAPSELADVIAFLCSHAARAVHGAAIPVSGRI